MAAYSVISSSRFTKYCCLISCYMRKDLEKKIIDCRKFPENHLSIVVNSDWLQKMPEPTVKVDQFL